MPVLAYAVAFAGLVIWGCPRLQKWAEGPEPTQQEEDIP